MSGDTNVHPACLSGGGRHPCNCLSECLAQHRLLKNGNCYYDVTDILLLPIFVIQGKRWEQGKGRKGAMSWVGRMKHPWVLPFWSCCGRGECPFASPGDIRSHQSFNIYTSDIFLQPDVLMCLIFIANIHMAETSVSSQHCSKFFIRILQMRNVKPRDVDQPSKVTQLGGKSKAGFGSSWSVINILSLCTRSPEPKKQLAAIPAYQVKRDIIISLFGDLIKDAFRMKQRSRSSNLLSLQILTQEFCLCSRHFNLQFLPLASWISLQIIKLWYFSWGEDGSFAETEWQEPWSWNDQAVMAPAVRQVEKERQMEETRFQELLCSLFVNIDLHDRFEVENGNLKIIDKEWQLV